MSETRDMLEHRLRDWQVLHSMTYEQVAMARKKLAELSLEDLADCASVLNDLEKLADDTRKECRMLSELMQKTACVRWATSGSTEETIRGERCTATPTIREMRALPDRKRDPEKYEALMKHLGATPETIDSGVLSLHWPSMVEYLSHRAEQGLPPPPGLEGSTTYEQYSLTIRRKRT